jgi:1A family penicillin-binding protein
MIKYKIMKYLKKHYKKILIYLFSVGFIALGILAFWISTFKMPDLGSFEARTVTQSTKIYDRTGATLLFDLNQDIKRKTVPYTEISPYIKNATVAIEDAGFFTHGGIQIKAIIRAVLANLTGGSTQGGSTITQQVIKNSLLTSERAISRKLKEWILAVRLEKTMSKDEILNIYLNENPYGGSIYGVEEAAQTFFGKKASTVSLAEAAYLAAIPNAPTFYSPYGNNKQRLDERKNLTLQKMLDNKFITQVEYDKAKKEVVTFIAKQGNGIKAPHFVEYARQYLEDKYGEKVVREDGLKVTTTLDYTLQAKAEEIVKKYALENKVIYNAENAALVAIDPKTGEILTMVGSRDYFDKEIGGNFNVALAHRQPGSTFKPFVYATAFNKGYTPDTVLFDLPTEFQTTCDVFGKPIGNASSSDCYMPENYDGKYLGPMTLRDALAQSRNIPSIKLLYLAGIKDSLDTARNMGIKSLGDANQYGLTLVLGGGEVSPLDLTSAYGVFANEGVRNPYISILKVENARGEILEQASYNPEQVISAESANKISDILSDNVARTPAYGVNSPLNIASRPVAVKTGTTNDYRDVWIVGYAPNLVVGAWVGNNDNSPMVKKTAGLIISPMWRAFMDVALPTIPKEYFNSPEPTSKEIKPVFRGVWQGYDFFTIDRISGKLATDLTPEETRQDIYIPNVHEILYWVDKNDPYGAVPDNPENDSQFDHWEYPVQEWLKTQVLPTPEKPKKEDDVHTTAKSPKPTITSPVDGFVYNRNQKITVQITNQSPYILSKVDFYINNTYVGSSATSPFLFSFTPTEINSINNGDNILKVIATDMIYNRGEKEVNFQVAE